MIYSTYRLALIPPQKSNHKSYSIILTPSLSKSQSHPVVYDSIPKGSEHPVSILLGWESINVYSSVVTINTILVQLQNFCRNLKPLLHFYINLILFAKWRMDFHFNFGLVNARSGRIGGDGAAVCLSDS